jgi:hypothetical protein
VRYDINDSWRTYGAWGQFTQAQRVDEYRSEGNQTTPDPATRAVHLLSGIAHESSPDARWRVEAYRNQWTAVSPYFDNTLAPVSLIPALEPDRVLITPSSAEAIGVEISASRSLGYGLSTWGIYSRSRVTDRINGRDVPRSWDQENASTIGLSWTHRRTSMSALVGWHSGWPRTPLAEIPLSSTGPGFLDIGPRNSARWGDYLSVDLRLSRSFPLRYGDLSLWIYATNVTDRANDCCVDLNSLSDSGRLPSATDKIWAPRVVNVGFSWRLRGSGRLIDR